MSCQSLCQVDAPGEFYIILSLFLQVLLCVLYQDIFGMQSDSDVTIFSAFLLHDFFKAEKSGRVDVFEFFLQIMFFPVGSIEKLYDPELAFI